jgi:hypothetical protein
MGQNPVSDEVKRVCPLSDTELVDRVLEFVQVISSRRFYLYQLVFSRRIVESIILRDGAIITGLWARQSGKTEALANLGFGLCVILPVLANVFPDDPRLSMFRRGFWVGIFAPILEQATISFERMRKLTDPTMSPETVEVMADEDINVGVTTNRGDTLSFTNGSFIQARSASPDSQVEGKTFHLVLLEETQKLLESKVIKEIRPMLASTRGTMACIGTAWVSRGGFHKFIQQNLDRWKRTGIRNHFEFPYDLVIREKNEAYNRDGQSFHLNYEAFVKDEIENAGGIDSLEFKMNFRCLWQESRQIAVDPEVLKNIQLQELEAGYYGYIPNTIQVAGLDVGKINDSTVLTLLEIDRTNPVVNPIKVDGQDEEKQVYWRKRVVDWVVAEGAFEGRDGQYQRVVSYLLQTAVQVLCIDSTGMGDAVAERFAAMLGDRITVVPVTFSTPMKARLYKYLMQELHSYRVFLPAGPATSQSVPFRRCVQELADLDRVQHANYVMYSHPPGDGNHDDFPDSLALACHAEKILDEVQLPEIQVDSFTDVVSSTANSGRRGDKYRMRR